MARKIILENVRDPFLREIREHLLDDFIGEPLGRFLVDATVHALAGAHDGAPASRRAHPRLAAFDRTAERAGACVFIVVVTACVDIIVVVVVVVVVVARRVLARRARHHERVVAVASG